jgi:hypothetical protein
MSVNINDNEYIFEDEELDDIEYLEIMSLDDIIKETNAKFNPDNMVNSDGVDENQSSEN